MAAPLLLQGYTGMASTASVLFGLALVLLAVPQGRIASHFGAWDSVAHFGWHGRHGRHAAA